MDAIKVFYTPQQSVERNDSFSPSAGKPALVLDAWKQLPVPIDISRFPPLSQRQLSLAHDPQYVADVLACRRANGFGNCSPEIAASLPWTNGSMAAAARYVYQNGGIAASLTSGFHHARYAHGSGFCTFNGLMIAVRLLLEAGAQKIGICDIDAHYGDGTDDIITETKLREHIVHYTFGGTGQSRDPLAIGQWMAQLPWLLEMFLGVDILLYQAGADPWRYDMLGGYLTKLQLARRDEIVFEFCKKHRIPIAFNLAGGNGDPLQHVLDIHNNTLLMAGKVYLGLIEMKSLLNIDDGQRPRDTTGAAPLVDLTELIARILDRETLPD